MSPPDIEYLQLLTRYQGTIYGYICSLAPGISADDVLQEVNIVLWEKASTFVPDTSFKAFALRIAYLKTLEALRSQKREGWMHFDSDLLEAIAAKWEDQEDSSARQEALRRCLSQMSPDDRRLIHSRYTLRQTVREIAKNQERSEGALQQAFFRLRGALKDCIERRLLQEGGGA